MGRIESTKLIQYIRKTTKFFLIGTLLFFAFSFLSNSWIKSHSDPYIFSLDQINSIPKKKVALVLGASKHLKSGHINPYFYGRMKTAATLYKKGIVKHILVSGDNHVTSYDEPSDMLNYLISLGVPEKAITLDYAGFRTLDSVVRANEIFGLNDFIIVSQKFHNQRAIFIAHKKNIQAIAVNAPAVRSSRYNTIREYLAKTKAVLDLYVLFKSPRFLGDKEPIQIANN